MNIKTAKENVMKNLATECEKVQGSRYRPSRPRNEKPYLFEIGKFVQNAMDEIEKMTRMEIDNEFLSKATMIVSGLKGDLWQITKKDWNRIMGRGNQFIEPGELPKGYVAVKKGKSKRVTPFNRKRV